ncbi:hypothetical protein F4X90_20350 [Candidatus Poribacteria bacterium]|nr:hypothetical protein [Candidatus Poribacteria bacterium]
MSDENRESTDQFPEFNEKEEKWVKMGLAVLPLKVAVNAFLDKFHRYYDHDKDMSPDVVKEKIENRFRYNLYEPKSPCYDKIQKNKAKLDKLRRQVAAIMPVCDPINEMIELERIRQNPSIEKANILLRALSQGRKVYERYYVPNKEGDTSDSSEGDIGEAEFAS